MFKAVRGRLTYANVMSTLAVFGVLGGGAYAAATINSGDVVNNSLKSADLKDGDGVRSADVRDDSLAGGGLTGADIDESLLGQVPQAAQAGNADTLDGSNSTDFLGANAKAADANLLDGKDSNVFQEVGSEAWRALPLRYTGGAYCHWTAYGGGFSSPSYFRDRDGIVHLRGMIKAVPGSDPSYPCNLATGFDQFIVSAGGMPGGYRPEATQLFTVSSNNKPGRVDVRANGSIVIEVGYPTFDDAKAWLSLDGISFRCTPSGQNGCP